MRMLCKPRWTMSLDIVVLLNIQAKSTNLGLAFASQISRVFPSTSRREIEHSGLSSNNKKQSNLVL